MKKFKLLLAFLFVFFLAGYTSTPVYSQCDPVQNINCFQCHINIFNDCVVDIDYADNIYTCQPDHTHVDEICSQHDGDPEACLNQINNDCIQLTGITGYYYKILSGICYPCFDFSKELRCNPPQYSTLAECEAVPDPPSEPVLPAFEPDHCTSQRCIAHDLLTGDCIDYSIDPGIVTAIGCLPYHPFEFLRSFRGVLISMGGGIALLLMIIAAFFVLTSKGNSEQIQRGKEIFTSALIGLLILISSVFLLRLISVDLLDLL